MYDIDRLGGAYTMTARGEAAATVNIPYLMDEQASHQASLQRSAASVPNAKADRWGRAWRCGRRRFGLGIGGRFSCHLRGSKILREFRAIGDSPRFWPELHIAEIGRAVSATRKRVRGAKITAASPMASRSGRLRTLR